MSNHQIYWELRTQGLPSPIAAQAADLISAKYDEFAAPDSLSADSLKGLIASTVALYQAEGDTCIETLKQELI